MACQGIPTLCIHDKDEKGISYWLVFGKYLAVWANKWGVVGQLLSLVLAGLFMALFMALECVVWAFRGFLYVVVLVFACVIFARDGGMLLQKK